MGLAKPLRYEILSLIDAISQQGARNNGSSNSNSKNNSDSKKSNSNNGSSNANT